MMLNFRHVANLCLGAAMAMAIASCSGHDTPSTPTSRSSASLHPTLPPNREITSSAVTLDGAVWYSYDRFDDVGGSPPGAQNGRLYRLEAGQISDHKILGTIRTLEVGPDGDLYVAAGCGLMKMRNGIWESAAEVDCARSTFSGPMVSFDIAFAPDGAVWLAGIHSLARFDGRSWVEYGVNARRLTALPDGTVWAEGWDGRMGSRCCFVQVRGTDVVTYDHTAALPVAANELREIRELANR
jgi:streptogramin lyase